MPSSQGQTSGYKFVAVVNYSHPGKMAEWSKAPALGIAVNQAIDIQHYRIRWSERAWVRTPLFSSLLFFCRRRFIDPTDIDRDIQFFVFGPICS
jgi:hypothetical protein